MRLLDFRDGEVTASAETLMLKPFKAIWDRDHSKAKLKAKRELALVFHNCDSRSTYLTEVDDNERIMNICEDVGLGTDYKVDKIIQNAFDFYVTKRTAAEILLDGLRVSAMNTKNYLIDTSAHLGDSDVPVNQFTSSLKTLMSILEQLDKLERTVGKTLDDEDNVRGGKDGFSMFENGINNGRTN